MFDIFGEMGSAEEINRTADGLKAEGDTENILKLAEENGIDAGFAQMYIDGDIEELCDIATAAFGKIDIEAAQLECVEIMDDWKEYIKTACLTDDELAVAVRRKEKSLKGCIGALLKYSFENAQDVDREILKASGVRAAQVKLGIPGMGRAKQIIRDYYKG